MLKFLSDNTWEVLKSLSINAKTIKIAVAYFGRGASEIINLKKGDTLIVAMHLNNIKAGQVDPFEIEKLFLKGVNIYNLPNLHSKIFIFDNQLVVGSSNVSINSINNLIESAILTDDKNAVANAKQFISDHSIEKVELDYIEVCKDNYNPPKFEGKGVKPIVSKYKGQLSRLWLISTKRVDFDEEDYEVLEKDEHVFQEKISNKNTFELTEIKYPASSSFIKQVQEGDIVIEIVRHKVKTIVVQPKRALGVTWNSKKTSGYLRVEERISPITKSWVQLEKLLKQNGVKAISKNSTREIKNNDIKKVLLNYFK